MDAIKVFIFIFFIMPLGNVLAMDKKPDCKIDEKIIHDDVRSFIYKKELEKASEYLISQQACADTNFEKAILLDYQGEIQRAAYTYSGGIESVAKGAEDFYQKALGQKTNYDVVVYHHLALLMRDKKEYPLASKYISKALNFDPQPEDVLPYLGTALQIAAESENWKQARELAGLLYNRKNSYFFNTRLLLPSVQTFCVTGEIHLASQFISLIEQHKVQMDGVEQKYYEKSKEALKECKDKVI